MQQELSLRNPNTGSIIPGSSSAGSSQIAGFPQGGSFAPGTVLIPAPGQPNLYMPVIPSNPNALLPGSIIIHNNNFVGQETTTTTRQEGGDVAPTQTTEQLTESARPEPERGSFSVGRFFGYLALYSVGLLSGILGKSAYDSKKSGAQIRQNRSSQNRIRRLQLGPMATFEF